MALNISKRNKAIILGTIYSVLSLAVAFSGTIAWFTARRNISVTAGGFSVEAEKGQEVELYFYKGNLNTDTGVYSGYETPAVSSFDEDFIRCDNDGYTSKEYKEGKTFPSDKKNHNTPVDTSRIWPGYSLTYALVFTPYKEAKYGLKLTSFSAKDSDTLIQNTEIPRSLAFAIDRFGYLGTKDDEPVYLTKDASLSLIDQFKSTPENPIKPDSKTPILPPSEEKLPTTEEKVLYFTIFFSDSKDTYYSLAEENDTEYYVKDENGNSNCYEGLTLSVTSFELTINEE